MPGHVFAIAATSVLEQDAVSCKFIATSGAPHEARSIKNIGVLLLKRKPDGYVAPFKLARGEAGAVGDDGTRRWNLSVGSEARCLLAGSVDQSGGERGLRLLLSELFDNDLLEDVVLLTTQEALPFLEEACGTAGIELESFTYEGSLATA